MYTQVSQFISDYVSKACIQLSEDHKAINFTGAAENETIHSNAGTDSQKSF